MVDKTLLHPLLKPQEVLGRGGEDGGGGEPRDGGGGVGEHKERTSSESGSA